MTPEEATRFDRAGPAKELAAAARRTVLDVRTSDADAASCSPASFQRNGVQHAKVGVTGRGAAWLARLTGGQEVGSSNLPVPILRREIWRFLGDQLGRASRLGVRGAAPISALRRAMADRPYS